ncbi:uncharacterized protein AAGF69_016344 isoform 2-T2 [Amazona ochrocephala]
MENHQYLEESSLILWRQTDKETLRQQHLDNANAKIQAWKCRKRKPEVFGSCSVPVHRHMQTHQQLLWGSGCCKQYAAQGKSSPKEERGLKRQKSLKGYPFIISLYKCSSNTG